MQKHHRPECAPEGAVSFSLGSERIGVLPLHFRWQRLVAVLAISILAAFGVSRINATIHYLNRLSLEDRRHRAVEAAERAAVLMGPALMLTGDAGLRAGRDGVIGSAVAEVVRAAQCDDAGCGDGGRVGDIAGLYVVGEAGRGSGWWEARAQRWWAEAGG